MILPSKNKKTYGVVHTENYFSFLGFCKKVNNNEIQKVDIFLNDTLIDTIIADKHIEKIEDIYELEGFGFNYVLPNKYIGQKNLISFRNQETKEDLQNSPYELIDETHPKFNEYKFLSSLQKTVIEDKIKNLYSPNCIGFFATEENLENQNFVKYIKNLYKRLPLIKFKIFHFNKDQKNKTFTIFSEEIDSLEFHIPENIYNLAKEIEIFIDLDGNTSDLFIKSLLKNNQQIILLIYANNENILDTKLNDLISVDDKTYQALKKLNISDDTIEKCNHKWILSTWDGFFTTNKINYQFEDNLTLGKFLIDIIELSLSYKICKKHIIQIIFTYFEVMGIFKESYNI